MALFDRGIEKVLKQIKTPAIILEGPRASGKSTVVKKVFPNYQLIDLSIKEQRDLCENNPELVFSSSDKFIVDEAQLVKDLGLTIKNCIDVDNKKFILTGSAPINRQSLGGTDPLSGRSTYLKLSMCTSSEMNNSPLNVLDQLLNFDSKKFNNFYTNIGIDSPKNINNKIINEFKKSKMPISYNNDLSERDLESYFESLSQLQKGDSRRFIKLLNYLSINSGLQLNVSKIAIFLDCNYRTAIKYVQDAESIYAINSIGNLASKKIDSPSNNKVYINDVAQTFYRNYGHNFNPLTMNLGTVFETYVINEIIAQAQWQSKKTSCYFWRKKVSGKYHEVDLVVEQSNKSVAIEIKSSNQISEKDCKGFLKLAESSKQDGYFVINMSDRVMPLEVEGLNETITVWQIPISVFLGWI